MITARYLSTLEPDAIISKGTVENTPDPVGIFMSSDESLTGVTMKWIAIWSGFDWRIYVGLDSYPYDYIALYGDTVTIRENVMKLVPHDLTAWNRYNL